MKVYFGNTNILEKPHAELLKRSNFGKGFYTSIDKDVAEYWAEVKKENEQEENEEKKLKKYINIYEFEESDDLRILDFSKMEKFDFEFLKRDKEDNQPMHNYDVIKGPVIDEKLLQTIEEYKKNIAKKEDLLNMLLLYRSINEISFHTKKAMEKLKFLYAEEIV